MSDKIKTYIQEQIRAEITSCLLKNKIELFVDFLDIIVDRHGNDVLLLINNILVESYLLNQLINQILGNKKVFQTMVKESYSHENGFYKIVLLKGNNFKLRLHQFGALKKAPMENIHNHRWPFVSTIIFGKLKMEIFQNEFSLGRSEELYHFVYGSDKSKGEYSTTLMGTKVLYKTESKVFVAGESYLMLPNEMHRITNICGENSITLILTGKPISNCCDLYATRPILDNEKQIVNYTNVRIREILNDIQKTICVHLN